MGAYILLFADSSDSELERCLPERGMKQEEQHHQCTSRAQEDLDAEYGRSHSDALERDNNPLCPKKLLKGTAVVSKRLQPMDR